MKMPGAESTKAATVRDSVRVKIALVVFGLTLGLLLAEIGLRLYNPFGFRMRGNTIVLPIDKTYVIEDSNFDRFDLLDRRVTHTKNSLGFRGPEPPADFEQRLTIIAIGGSTTECFYLSDGQDWPAVLQASLKPKFSKIWLNNAGLDGHSSFGNIVLLRDYVSRLRPKVVLILVGINDLFADGPKSLDHLERSELAGSVASHSELFGLGLNLIRYWRTAGMKSLGAMPKALNLREPEYVDIATEEEISILDGQERFLPEYESRLVQLIHTARENGIEPVLITQPALFGEGVDDVTQADLSRVSVEIYRRMNGRMAWKLLEKYNEVTREVAHAHNAGMIDLARQLPKSSRYYYDYLHYGKEGAAKVADIVANELCPMLQSRWPDQVTGPCN
jgi:lysophospholipase L1-like esterase